MWIRNPNDEQLSAWLGERYDTATGQMIITLGGMCKKFTFPLWWPDDWPDLSREAMIGEMNDRLVELVTGRLPHAYRNWSLEAGEGY